VYKTIIIICNIFGTVSYLQYVLGANLGTVAIPTDGDLLELGNPDWHGPVPLGGRGEVVAVFRVGFQLSFRDDLGSMVIQTVDDRPSWLKVHIHGGSLRFLGKATLRLEVILKFVDHWPGWAHVSESGLHLSDVLKVTLRFEVILDWSHNVGSGHWHGLVDCHRL